MKELKLNPIMIISKKNNGEEIWVTSIEPNEDLLYKITGISTLFMDYFLEGKSKADIVAAITSAYDIEKEIVEKDVKSFVDDLLKHQIFIES